MLDLGRTYLQSVERSPNARAIVDAALTLTYAQWHRIIVNVAAGLRELGLAHGDRLLVVLQNRWEMATLHWACQFAGIVIVLAVAVRTGQEGSRVPVSTQEQGPVPAMVQRDDDALWRGGLVYVNQDDPAVFVPRRFGIGWTVNLGNRLVWVLLVAAAGLVVAVWALTA